MPGLKNKLFGGDFFLMRLTGPGKVWLQSLSVQMLAEAISPYLPQPTVTTTNGSLQSAAVGGGIEVALKGLGKLL